MTLQQELTHGTLSRVSPDEPIFVLRALDRNAPSTIREWISLSILTGLSQTKITDAEHCAERMEDWMRNKSTGGSRCQKKHYKLR